MTGSETTGAHIRRLREEKGMSLAELARQASLSKAYLSQIESGQASSPSAQILYSIASVLGTSVAALLGSPVPAPDGEIVISTSLEAFARSENLSEDDKLMLARIRYRGKQPQTEEDWRWLYESVKRSVSGHWVRR